jgi:hypothetical protein
MNLTDRARARASELGPEEIERLRAALEGQPVIKSEWEEKCEEVERLRRLVDVAGREEGYAIDQAEALEARIEAALALLEGDDHYMMAERAVKALKGGE